MRPTALPALLALAACGQPAAGLGHFESGEEETESGPEGESSETGETTGEDTGDSATSTEDATSSTGEESSETEGWKFDTQPPDLPGMVCPCDPPAWSYIWIANSTQSTVSKVDTATVTELGRYWTRQDKFGNPSRTSVSVDGQAVAVANRASGVVKIWAREEFCDEDKNGMPGLQTSSGANDVLAWGEDDCIAWYTAFPGVTKQRPIAWDLGVRNPMTCEYEQQKLWTTGCAQVFDPVKVYRLDGDTGIIEDTVMVPEMPCGELGSYGGAVDGEGDFWFIERGAKLARMDRESLDYELWPTVPGIGAYGIAVDHLGRPWVTNLIENQVSSGIAVFDPQSETWATVDDVAQGYWSGAGLMEGPDGVMWASVTSNPGYMEDWDGVIGIDVDTLELVDEIKVPEAGFFVLKGVSVDVAGYVWAVLAAAYGDRAYRIDPEDHTMQMLGGLNGAYTYSDMTGWGLHTANCAPQG